MPCELMIFVIAFAPLFSKPFSKHVKVLPVGTILSSGSRAAGNALRIIELSSEKDLQNFRRVCNRTVRGSLWSGGESVTDFDDTIERCRGRKI